MGTSFKIEVFCIGCQQNFLPLSFSLWHFLFLFLFGRGGDFCPHSIIPVTLNRNAPSQKGTRRNRSVILAFLEMVSSHFVQQSDRPAWSEVTSRVERSNILWGEFDNDHGRNDLIPRDRIPGRPNHQV